MLMVEIKLDGQIIAGARIQNVSCLADIANYDVTACEAFT